MGSGSKKALCCLLRKILDRLVQLEDKFPCLPAIPISSVPFVIPQSNRIYCLTNNLILANDSTQPAIVVPGGISDIVIDLAQQEIQVGPTQIAIQLGSDSSTSPVENITIKNGSIHTVGGIPTNDLNAGISFDNNGNLIESVLIDNVKFYNLWRSIRGLSISNPVIDVVIRNSTFDLSLVSGNPRSVSFASIQNLLIDNDVFLSQPSLAGQRGQISLLLTNVANVQVNQSRFLSPNRSILIQSVGDPSAPVPFSRNVVITESEFQSSFQDLAFNGVTNVKVLNCNFFEDQQPGIGSLLFQSSGGFNASNLIVEECNFTSTAEGTPFNPQGTHQIRLGSNTTDAQDVIIRKCNFRYRAPLDPAARQFYNDIHAVQVEGLLIEDCIFDNNNVAVTSDGSPIIINGVAVKSANIHLGFRSSPTSGTRVQNVRITNSIMQGPSQVGVYLETFIAPDGSGDSNENVVIEACNITGVEAGILLDNTNNSSVTKNQISNVSGSVVGPSPADGVSLIGTSTNNVISYNNITGNVGNGISVADSVVRTVIKENILVGNGNPINNLSASTIIVNNIP